MRGKKARLAAGMAAAGACVLLAACSPAKIGSAAIVGNQRISSASLDAQVANLQQAARRYGTSVVQVPTSSMPQVVLGWLVTFKIRDKTAAANGLSVSQQDIQAALADLQQNAASQGATNVSPQEIAASNGVPPDLTNDFGRWFAQELAFIKQRNHGTIPTDQNAQAQAVGQLATVDCKSQRALNIQVNPQYGQLAYDSSSNLYGIIGVSDKLSRTPGTPSAAPQPSLPSC